MSKKIAHLRIGAPMLASQRVRDGVLCVEIPDTKRVGVSKRKQTGYGRRPTTYTWNHFQVTRSGL